MEGSFDVIYKRALWCINVAEEYNTTTTKVTELLKAFTQFHSEGDAKKMIEEGFIQAREERINGGTTKRV